MVAIKICSQNIYRCSMRSGSVLRWEWESLKLKRGRRLFGAHNSPMRRDAAWKANCFSSMKLYFSSLSSCRSSLIILIIKFNYYKNICIKKKKSMCQSPKFDINFQNIFQNTKKKSKTKKKKGYVSVMITMYKLNDKKIYNKDILRIKDQE